MIRMFTSFHPWFKGKQAWQIALLTCLLLLQTSFGLGQHSIARTWNEMLLESIREDFARPTVHARNLFHISSSMYDIWTVFNGVAEPYLLGKTVHGFSSEFESYPIPEDSLAIKARDEAISFAAYRLISHRFQRSPGAEKSLAACDSLMAVLGYDISNLSTDYSSGDPAALGNYVASQYIAFGLQDGANEENDYANLYYQPANSSFAPTIPGNSTLTFPNRWQPLTFDLYIDQSGNPIPINSPPFLGPEWGKVAPFSLSSDDLSLLERDGEYYWVYHDPGPPPFIDQANAAEYQWGFSLVALWSSHLDPADGVLWDISPATIGEVPLDSLPTTIEGLREFYRDLEGGDPSIGHEVNPHTGLPYEPQLVPRGDYTRVLAEFWADGPESETPPGHWFTILNYVNDHSEFEKQFQGEGRVFDELEWDVKAYFLMGGAMHDAAVTSWGIKGYYDYLRPVSAIRWMADQGQSSEPSFPSYHPQGIPLVPNLIELVLPGDSLALLDEENIGKVKIFGWRGPDFITDPEIDVAGVGWILAENWWPYQRPTFVTPPFAGYISGHSTFSRTAAEVMTLLTGDAFFPGGMGEFVAKKNEFLVFEEGPSVDVVLQWATYRDASDQTSLSRIWGGIHPPVDDIPGRLIGIEIGQEAFDFAEAYFRHDADTLHPDPNPDPDPVVPLPPATEEVLAFPNPLQGDESLRLFSSQTAGEVYIQALDLTGRLIWDATQDMEGESIDWQGSPEMAPGLYLIRVISGEKTWQTKLQVE